MKKQITAEDLVGTYNDELVAMDFIQAVDLWPEEKIIFKKYFERLGHVLDLGCGAGRTSFALAKFGNRVDAVDFSDFLINAARERLEKESAEIRFRVKDIRYLDYGSEQFNGAVFSYNGIGHIPKREGKLNLLCSVYKFLKPGGIFFFTAHNFWCLDSYFFGNLKNCFSSISFHGQAKNERGERYVKLKGCALYLDIKSRKEWLGIIKSAGFEILEFNSRLGLSNRRPYGICDLLGSKNFLFFVLVKPNK